MFLSIKINRRRDRIILLLSWVLGFFWLYCFFIKVLWYQQWHSEMMNQIFSKQLATFLYYLLPICFLALGILFVKSPYKTIASYLSLLFWLPFTCYISLVKMQYFKRIPCSCAAIIPGISWNTQLYINLTGLLLTLLLIYLQQQERRFAGH
ncbi:MAG: MauE/DoxX family redox-associated membrane protein [Pelobium sp.]